MKQFVISGINLFEGGPLSIYYDCLDTIIKLKLYEQYEVVAFVHKKELFAAYSRNIKIRELPKSRQSYLNRMYYEYVYFWAYSKKNDVDIWLSLHDMTPRVKARKVYTYCHNVSPFIKKDIRNLKYSVTNVVFSYFYRYIYCINIKKATAIIVQTAWMRDAFKKMYPVKDVIVARPNISIEYKYSSKKHNYDNKKVFIYPVYPRYFKNFEVICEAAKGLDEKTCEIILTMRGNENNYAKSIYDKYKEVKAIRWVGLMPRGDIFKLYDEADCLIFSSSMETWGLPISEFKETGKDIILVDLPYARETLGEYKKVMFFGENDYLQLNQLINDVINSNQKYTPCKGTLIEKPCSDSWDNLIEQLTV